MKKRLLMILITVLLISFSVSAQATFPAFDDFETEFEFATILTSSGHYITTDNITYDIGEYAEVYNIAFSDTLAMLVTVPLATEEISEITLLYVSDGTTTSAVDFIFGISELALATGAISAVDESGEFLEALGILDHLEDGDSNAIIIGNLKYSYAVYSSLGIFFYVSEID